MRHDIGKLVQLIYVAIGEIHFVVNLVIKSDHVTFEHYVETDNPNVKFMVFWDLGDKTVPVIGVYEFVDGEKNHATVAGNLLRKFLQTLNDEFLD